MKLTPELKDVVMAGIRADLTYKLAAEGAGVSERAFYKWIAAGDRDEEQEIDSIYRQFVQALRRERAKRAEFLIARIRKAGAKSKHWQATAWMLERGHRSQFSLHGDKFEALEKAIAALTERIEKRQGKSVGAKAADEEENPRKDKKNV